MLRVRSLLLVSLLTAGCMEFGGKLEETQAPGTFTGGVDSREAPPLPTPLPCNDVTSTTLDGHHFAGQDCTGACHDGITGPLWTLAGTLYTSTAGTTVKSGATIHILDADGVSQELTTALNGNFWTAVPVRFPIRTWVSACPSTAAMVQPVADGACNACHGQNMRIALP